MNHRWFGAAGAGLAALLACGAARGQYIPFARPAKTRPMLSADERRLLGYEFGNPLHGV